MKSIKIIIPIIAILLFSSYVSAVCTISSDKPTYSAGQTVLITGICNATGEGLRPYYIYVRNSTGYLLDTISGTTGSTGAYFYDDWQIPSTLAAQNINLTLNVSALSITYNLLISPLNGTNNISIDYSRFSNNGTNYNGVITNVTGVKGTAYSYDGSNDYTRYSPIGDYYVNLDGGEGLMTCLSFNISTTNSNGDPLFDTLGTMGVQITYEGGRIRFKTDSSGTGADDTNSVGTYIDGQWHKYCAYVNKTTKLVFIDGGNTEYIVDTTTQNGYMNLTSGINLGGSIALDKFLEASLDEVCVRRGVFSAATVNSSYYNNLTCGTDDSTSSIASTKFNMSIAGLYDLIIGDVDVLYDGDWKWYETNAISAVVKDYENNLVVNAQCKIIIEDNDGAPFYTQESLLTGARGKVVFPIYLSYDTFDLGEYAAFISCWTTDQSRLASSNQSINYQASGYAIADFTISEHMIMNSVYIVQNATDIQAQDTIYVCADLTNNYRDYAGYYVIDYHIVCDVPNQDVLVGEIYNTEFMNPYETNTFCPPFILPEIASSGTGYCRAWAGAYYDDHEELTGEYYDYTDPFYVYPKFAQLVNAEKLPETNSEYTSVNATFILYGSALDQSSIYVRIPFIVQGDWSWDKIKNATLYVGNETIDGVITVTGISGYDLSGDPEKVNNMEEVLAFRFDLPTNFTISDNDPFYMIANAYSEVGFWQSFLNLFSRLVAAIEGFTGLGTSGEDRMPIGNYTIINSSMNQTTVGASPLIIDYNISVSNSTRRKDLHFRYDFAPMIDGVESGFYDQNPYTTAYQSLDVYQAIILNQTKAFRLRLYPRLEIGNYTMYETIYEKSGEDERIVAQNIYSISVDSLMEPNFEGDTIRIDGVVMYTFG